MKNIDKILVYKTSTSTVRTTQTTTSKPPSSTNQLIINKVNIEQRPQVEKKEG